MDGRPQIQRKLSLSSTSIPDTGEKVNLRMDEGRLDYLLNIQTKRR